MSADTNVDTAAAMLLAPGSLARPRRVLLLFSDTGGGHRAGARAVAEALNLRYGPAVHVEMVDALADYAPWPWHHLPAWYPYMTGLQGRPWQMGFLLSDGPHRIQALSRTFWLIARRRVFQLLHDYPVDVIVSIHPALNHLLVSGIRALKLHTPAVTIVQDLVSTHALWFARRIDRCLVPTEAAHARALYCGIPAERVVVTGLPVAQRFVDAARLPKAQVRDMLGLQTGPPVVLLIGGGEGMGPVESIARAIAHSGRHLQMVVIAGRNTALQRRLLAQDWPVPVRVEGFVHNVHEWMRASDVLVTKAGPNTICEAFTVGLPVVLSGALPGQEVGNVRFVLEGEAGMWAPNPAQAARAVARLVNSGGVEQARMAARALALARPQAADNIAQILWDLAGRASR